jgi:hypothetical protein
MGVERTIFELDNIGDMVRIFFKLKGLLINLEVYRTGFSLVKILLLEDSILEKVINGVYAFIDAVLILLGKL